MRTKLTNKNKGCKVFGEVSVTYRLKTDREKRASAKSGRQRNEFCDAPSPLPSFDIPGKHTKLIKYTGLY